MEHKKEVVTLSAIKEYLMKLNFSSMIFIIISTACVCLLFSAANLLFKMLILKIITVVALLIGLVFIADDIISMVKIRKNTYFQIRTDTLIDKKDHIWSGLRYNHAVNRLFFKYNTYDISPAYKHQWCDLYNMDKNAVFQTSSIGDSFTLVEHKKEIILLFNNKLFDIKIDS